MRVRTGITTSLSNNTVFVLPRHAVRWGASSEAQMEVYPCYPPVPAQAVTDVEAFAFGAAVTSGEAPAGQGAVGATAPTESQALG